MAETQRTKREIISKDGTMTLRNALVHNNGDISSSLEIDDRTCECCQTDMAMTNLGSIIVYRDRSENEIRDIYYSLKMDSHWLTPKPVFSDNWYFPNCPVNGPAVSANGPNVLVSWITGTQDSAAIKLAFSTNGGLEFNSPILISDDEPLGRIDAISLTRNVFLISWLGKNENGRSNLNLTTFNLESSETKTYSITHLSSRRSSGFPRMVAIQESLFICWTDIDSLSQPKLARINRDELGF